MIAKAFGECITHLIVKRKIIGIRADDDKAAVRLPAASEIADKIIACIKDAGKLHACGYMVVAWTAGHKKNHKITCLRENKTHYSVLFRNCKVV